MPKIPTHDSQIGIQRRSLTRIGPGFRIPAGSNTGEARALSELGVTIQGIAENIRKVKADQEFATGKVEGFKALSEIELEASEDNEFNDFESKYSRRISEAKESILNNIKSPQAKAAFSQDFELKSAYSFHNMMASGRKRFVARDSDLMAEEVAITKERYFSAISPIEKQDAKNELETIFARRVDDNILSPVEGRKQHAESIESLDEEQAEWDIFKRPEHALEQLELGKKGAYPSLAPDKRVSLIKSTQSMIKTDQAYIKRVKNDKLIADRLDIIEKIASGEINLKDSPNFIRGMFGEDFKLAEAMKNSALKGSVTLEKESSLPFLEATKDMFKSGTPKQVTNFLINALDNPNISRDRLASLVYGAKKKAEELGRGEKNGFWSGLINHLFGSSFPDSEKIISNTLKRSQEENATDERAKEISEEETDKQQKTSRNEILNVNDTILETEGIQTFKSIEEGNAANLPKGTKVNINGRIYIMK